jgi:hypothetical protein
MEPFFATGKRRKTPFPSLIAGWYDNLARLEKAPRKPRSTYLGRRICLIYRFTTAVPVKDRRELDSYGDRSLSL